MKPVLKWAGGKTKLLGEILPVFPREIGVYAESFLGSGAVFFALMTSGVRVKKYLLNDANRELVHFYVRLKYDPEGLLYILRRYEKKHSESFYYELRDHDPLTMEGSARAARFFYLNKAGFNGLYRVNRAGKFNVPWGKHASFRFDASALGAASHALQRVELAAYDFEAILDRLKPGDFAYCDPPYLPLSKTARFEKYTDVGFGEKDHVRLRNAMVLHRQRGAKILLSNVDAPLTREIWSGFHAREVSAPRAINSKGDKRGLVGELLIATWIEPGFEVLRSEFQPTGSV